MVHHRRRSRLPRLHPASVAPRLLPAASAAGGVRWADSPTQASTAWWPSRRSPRPDSGCCSSAACASRSFKERIEKFRADVIVAAHPPISAVVPDCSLPNPASREDPAGREGSAAPGNDRQTVFFEKIQFGGGREWLGARARGRVLEVAVGIGRSLPHYPADAAITGVELSAAMLAVARRRVADLGRAVDLREGDAEHLPFADGSFDTVVCALLAVHDPRPGEADRGGEAGLRAGRAAAA
jgi:hypothetical protein